MKNKVLRINICGQKPGFPIILSHTFQVLLQNFLVISTMVATETVVFPYKYRNVVKTLVYSSVVSCNVRADGLG